MKMYSHLLFSLFIAVITLAETPEKISYQAVVRDAQGALVINEYVNLTINILRGVDSGAVIYQETHSTKTNKSGLISLEIGSGQTDGSTFSSIDWGNGPYFIKIKTVIDEETVVSTSELLSVPYALHAKNANRVNGFSVATEVPSGALFTDAQNASQVDLLTTALDIDGDGEVEATVEEALIDLDKSLKKLRDEINISAARRILSLGREELLLDSCEEPKEHLFRDGKNETTYLDNHHIRKHLKDVGQENHQNFYDSYDGNNPYSSVQEMDYYKDVADEYKGIDDNLKYFKFLQCFVRLDPEIFADYSPKYIDFRKGEWCKSIDSLHEEIAKKSREEFEREMQESKGLSSRKHIEEFVEKIDNLGRVALSGEVSLDEIWNSDLVSEERNSDLTDTQKKIISDYFNRRNAIQSCGGCSSSIKNNHNAKQSNLSSQNGQDLVENNSENQILKNNNNEAQDNLTTKFLDDNSVYEGALEEGVPNGFGTAKYSNGDTKLGKWEDGKFIKGVVKMRCKYGINSGGLYEGDWKNGQPNGEGQMNYNHGKYKGQWKDGKRHGQGLMTYANGDVFSGKWENDEPIIDGYF